MANRNSESSDRPDANSEQSQQSDSGQAQSSELTRRDFIKYTTLTSTAAAGLYGLTLKTDAIDKPVETLTQLQEWGVGNHIPYTYNDVAP
ncbi:twin-arginine translocation signal domain-containing protein [Thalassoglobus sp. JC818]|uniref:twin-arginine translocation signal domain-containing protein n=1 Tax=Thalassoglobus sp. JC818 TaxID=3232136 RepID=UPI00345A57F0